MKVKLLTFLTLVSSLLLSQPKHAGAQCAMPGTVNATWSCSSAVVFWPMVSTAVLYEYRLVSGSSILQGHTTTNSYMFSALTPSTIYMASVRTICGPNDTSNWTSPYTFVTPACNTCVMPAWVTVNPVSCDSIAFNWDFPTNTNGFEWQVSTSPTPSPTGWNFRTVPFASQGGLTGATVYFVHVRNVCGTNDYSQVKSTIITTPPCPPPCPGTGNMTTTATPHSITATWPAVGNAVAYEYVLDNNAGAPAAAGTQVTGNSVTINNLNPATPYYLHLRCNCGPNNYSPWSASHQVSTQQATGISNVTAGNVEVFPNPAGAELTIQLKKITEDAVISLMGIDGRVIKTLHPRTENVKMDISSLAGGIYFIQYSDKEQTETIRINKL